MKYNFVWLMAAEVGVALDLHYSPLDHHTMFLSRTSQFYHVAETLHDTFRMTAP